MLGTGLPGLVHGGGPPPPLPPCRQNREGFADPACERHYTCAKRSSPSPGGVLRRASSRDAPRDGSLRPTRAVTAMLSKGCFPCESYKCLSLSWQLMSHFSAASQPAPGRQERRQKSKVSACREPPLTGPENLEREAQEGGGCLSRDQLSPAALPGAGDRESYPILLRREHPTPHTPTGATQRPAGLPIHKEKAFPFHSPLPFLKFSYSVFLSFCCLIFSLSFTHPCWCPFLTGGTSASRDRAPPCWVSTNSAYSRRGKSN